jgi:hypothetical protein
MTAGTTYHIMLGGDFGSVGDLRFSAQDVTDLVPVNDDFDNALVIGSLPFADMQDTRVTFPATDDPSSTCETVPAATVWYRYTPPTTGMVRLSTLGSSYDTILTVYTGTRGSLTQVGCNDQVTGTITSLLTLRMTAGTTYHIMLGGDFGSVGDLRFSAQDVTGLVPVNDDFDNAIPVVRVRFLDRQDNRVNFPAPDDPVTCDPNVGGTIWYRYIAPADGTATFSTFGSNIDTILALYTGTRGNLTQVACNDDGGSGVTSLVTLNVTAGVTYYVLIGGDAGTTGDMRFIADVSLASAPGDCNGDNLVDAGDLSALTLEIFDDDGSDPLDTPGGTFLGNPPGCDANTDNAVDAGDLSCTVLIAFEGQGACSGP